MRAFELIEGRYDPHIFKAIFLAGGPGSGKSFVARQIIGGTGLRIINSDHFFEMMARRTGQNLGTLPGTPSGDLLHNKSRNLARNKMDTLIEGGIGLVIEGTGRNFNKIEKIKNYLNTKGYDSLLLLVNADLETALKRNLSRERKIPVNVIKASHKDIQNNIGKFQRLFGNNFIVVDNTDDTQTDFNKLWKDIKKWLDNPANNEYIRQWLDHQK